MTQTATLPTTQVSNAKNYDGDKNRIQSFKAVTKHPATGEWLTLVDIRLWKSFNSDGAAPVHASIWVTAPGIYIGGSGRATGYGYHKPSAAAHSAIISAGITLAKDIDGRGDEAIRGAIAAICTAIGFNDVYIVE